MLSLLDIGPVRFSDHPLRLVVGFPPGGPKDLLARIVAPGIGERLKRSLMVENSAGSNGEIAAAAVDATVRSPEVARTFVELGADPQFGSPREFAAYVAADKENWARLAREAGLGSE